MLLFGDDFQLFPVIDEGAIQGYSRMNNKLQQTPTTRMTSSQLLCQCGTYLFTQIMSETLFALDKNYRVKNNKILQPTWKVTHRRAIEGGCRYTFKIAPYLLR